MAAWDPSASGSDDPFGDLVQTELTRQLAGAFDPAAWFPIREEIAPAFDAQAGYDIAGPSLEDGTWFESEVVQPGPTTDHLDDFASFDGMESEEVAVEPYDPGNVIGPVISVPAPQPGGSIVAAPSRLYVDGIDTWVGVEPQRASPPPARIQVSASPWDALPPSRTYAIREDCGCAGSPGGCGCGG